MRVCKQWAVKLTASASAISLLLATFVKRVVALPGDSNSWIIGKMVHR
jgi:hypothetical protein